MRPRMYEYRGLNGHDWKLPKPPNLEPQPPYRIPDHLRPREEQLLRLLGDGKTIKEASSIMGITYRTSGAYLFQARQRLGARSTVQLISMMLQGKIDFLIGEKQHGRHHKSGSNQVQ